MRKVHGTDVRAILSTAADVPPARPKAGERDGRADVG